MNLGQIYIFTGDGKGKTSAALGTAMRAVGNSMQVAWVAWYKQKNWQLSEMQTLKQIGVTTYLLGEGFRLPESIKGKSTSKNQRLKVAQVGSAGVVVDTASEESHRQAAQAALRQAEQLIASVDVLVLDEVNNAVADGLLAVDDLLELLVKRGKTHLILTGRNAHKSLIEVADLVSQITKVKHPYDRGNLAIKGLDF